MNAPATEQPPAMEQPTQPLPLEPDRITERSWLMSEASEVLIPATILAAIGAGALIRNYVLVTEIARTNSAIVVLLGVVGVSLWVLILGRSRSGRDRNFVDARRRS